MKLPESRTRLAADSPIFCNKDFENATVKIQQQSTYDLDQEKNYCFPFPL